MAIAEESNERIDDQDYKLNEQLVAIEELGHLLNNGAMQQSKRDQVSRLWSLKERVMNEAEQLRFQENQAQYNENRGKAIVGGVSLLVGLLTTPKESAESGLSRGARFADVELQKISPFGNILIAIGQRGLPDEIDVVPVSVISREESRNEEDVLQIIERNGYLVIDPQRFEILMANLERKILDGSLSFPISLEQISNQLNEVYVIRIQGDYIKRIHRIP